MNTYEEFMVILTAASLVVAILNMNTMRNASISHVRKRRQMGMSEFPLALCFRANKKAAVLHPKKVELLSFVTY